ncbi:MAG TPA: PEGA domain-containing protein [Bacteroidales bacterium]|nr:PEGA domain-containing protein [Bacteroidales bacterium]
MKKTFFKTIALLLSTTILLSSCASTTMFQTTPTAAKIYVNDEYVGTTPYAYTDTKIVGTTTIVKIKAEGYQDFNYVLKRNEEANVGAIIGGILVLVPFLWTMNYKPMHNFELVPVN